MQKFETGIPRQPYNVIDTNVWKKLAEYYAFHTYDKILQRKRDS